MNSNIKPQGVPGPSGLLLIDKPAGISSFDIIRRLRRQTGVRKIGHAGTLDPAATGLMLMLFGRSTKQAGRLVGLDKSYQAEITLGLTSSTGDREGELTEVSSRRPDRAEIAASLESGTGVISQTPSAYSAIKVGGIRAYKLARAGKAAVIPPREVTVYAMELLNYHYPVINLKAEVSSGTYIRSLAADIGIYTGTGAYVSALRRLRVGGYTIDSAYQLEEVKASTLEQQFLSLPV